MEDCSEASGAAERLSEAIDEFLDALIGEGFSAGPAERLKVHHALLLLALREPLPELACLCGIVGPLVCRSAVEQERFRQRFKFWIGQRTAPGVVAEPEPGKDLLPSILKRSSRGRAVWLGIGAALLSVALGALGWLYGLRQPRSAAPAAAPPSVAIDLLTLTILAAAGAMLLASALFWWWRRRQVRLFLVKRKALSEAKLVPLEVGVDALFDRTAMAATAQELGRYRMVESPEFDPEKTVIRTAENAGFFVPVAARRPAVPEYLVLIDRAGLEDQHAGYADRLVTELGHSNLLLERFYFDRSPRLCYPASDPARPVPLSDLAASHAAHRMLLFSDGEGLFEARSGVPAAWLEVFQTWPDRVLLTPVARSNWSYRENALAGQGWLLLPPFAESLANFAAVVHNETVTESRMEYRGRYPELLERDQGVWTDRSKPPWNEIDELVASLGQYLGSAGFDWLAACAIYPAVDWNLTLFLGATLRDADGKPVLTGDLLVALIRLPWFRTGAMPDWLRRVLIGSMRPEAERHARAALQGLLLGDPSLGDEKFTLPIAPELKPQFGRFAAEVVRALSKDPPAGSRLEDQVYATFMSGRNPSALALPVPDRVAKLLGVRRANLIEMIRPRPDARGSFEPERPVAPKAVSEPVRPPVTPYKKAAATCYALGFLSGLLMLGISPYNRDRTVRFHAFQSILFWIIYLVLFAVIPFVSAIASSPALKLVVSILSPLLTLGLFVTWIVVGVQAYRNRPVVLPWIGRWAMRLADRRSRAYQSVSSASAMPGPQPIAGPAPMADNAAAALCYALGLITGIIFLLLARYKQNKTIRFHAFQSIFFHVACILIGFVSSVVIGIILAAIQFPSLVVLSNVVWLLLFVAWLYIIISTYRGRTVVLPIIGPFAQKLIQAKSTL